jgi:predicted PurR-regulated permease PerM
VVLLLLVLLLLVLLLLVLLLVVFLLVSWLSQDLTQAVSSFDDADREQPSPPSSQPYLLATTVCSSFSDRLLGRH